MAARGGAPLRVIFQELDIEPVHAARGADIKRALADLLDGGYAGKRQEEPEVIGKMACSGKKDWNSPLNCFMKSK